MTVALFQNITLEWTPGSNQNWAKRGQFLAAKIQEPGLDFGLIWTRQCIDL